MVTLIMSKFSLVGAKSALVKLATLWSDGELMGQQRHRCPSEIHRARIGFWKPRYRASANPLALRCTLRWRGNDFKGLGRGD